MFCVLCLACRQKTSISFLSRPDLPNLAYKRLKGKSPGIIFIPGYISNMNGTKALAIEEFCKSLGHAYIRQEQHILEKILPFTVAVENYLCSNQLKQMPAFFFNLFIYLYLFLAVLGLRFCARAFSSCDERGPLFIAVRGPLTIAASLVAGHRLQTRRLSSCGARAQLLCSMWDLPRPGLEPVSPALAGRFSTTVPPGKPKCQHFYR